MDHKKSNFLHQVPSFSSSHNVGGVAKGTPIVDSSCLDPFSKLSLMETSDFVKSSLPMVRSRSKKESAANKRNMVEAPTTPGRPVFSFSSVGNNNVSRNKFVPSKWNDAEKWLNSDHTQTHHLNGFVKSEDFVSKNINKSTSSNSNGFGNIKQLERHHDQTKVVSEKPSEEKLSKFQDHHHNLATPSSASDVPKDKFTNEVEPNKFLKFECWEPLNESFLFRENSSMVDGAGVRDIGTEMTPLGSSTTSRCPTPFKSLSPPRHNTPASRSGPLDPNTTFDIGSCHLLKLNLETAPFDSVVSNWSSREEEEEDISKSLRHFEMTNDCRKSVSSEPRVSVWEEGEKTKCCLRYQREEAKIQAWVELQNAKAEAQSRKLEVKIQKMRSKFEEKQMRKMSIVHRKAEELRAAAKVEHTEQIQKARQQPNKLKMINQHQHQNTHHCGCFPCNNLHP